jgi:hypothetical protein
VSVFINCEHCLDKRNAPAKIKREMRQKRLDSTCLRKADEPTRILGFFALYVHRRLYCIILADGFDPIQYDLLLVVSVCSHSILLCCQDGLKQIFDSKRFQSELNLLADFLPFMLEFFLLFLIIRFFLWIWWLL